MEKLKNYNIDGSKWFVTKSQLSTFSICPRQFYLRYLEKIRTPPTPAMVAGTRWHEWCEKFILHNTMLSEGSWHECIPESFTPTEKENAAWFIDMEYNQFNKLGRELWTPVCVEKKIKSHTQYLSGIIDRVDLNEDCVSVTLVEYKTGAKNKPSDIKLQSALYKKLWDEVNPTLPATSCRVINPVMRIAETYDIPKRSMTTVDKQIAALRDALDMNIFPQSCSMVMYSYCGLCKIEDVIL
jgi:CRISPR/Cas system-associated exonuclease Cas4 (RecB family)